MIYEIVFDFRTLAAFCFCKCNSGNQMGDTGARMLSKALQLNKKLIAIHWDHNGTSPTGFQDVASALEKCVAAPV